MVNRDFSAGTSHSDFCGTPCVDIAPKKKRPASGAGRTRFQRNYSTAAQRERDPVLRVAARLGERFALVDLRAVVFLGDRRAVVFLVVVFLAVVFLAADRFVVVVLAAPLRLVERLAVVFCVVVLPVVVFLVVFAVEDFFLGERLADAARPVVDCFAEDFLVVRFAAPLRFVERRAALVDRTAFLVPPVDRFFAPVEVRAAMEHGSFMTLSTSISRQDSERRRALVEGSIGRKRPSVRR